MISIVIPCLNERVELEATLAKLVPERAGNEVIVVDGGSIDGSRALADRLADQPWVRVVEAEGTRGALVNAGAKEAQGDILFILPPGVQPERGWSNAIQAKVQSGADAGALRLGFTSDGLGFRLLELGSRIQNAVLGLPGAGQGLFVRTKVFRQFGGWMDWNEGPGLEFVKRLRDHKVRVPVLPLVALHTGSEYTRDGLWWRARLNWNMARKVLQGATQDELAGMSQKRSDVVLFWYTHDDKDGVVGRISERYDPASAESYLHAMYRVPHGYPLRAATVVCPRPDRASEKVLDRIEKEHALLYQRGKGLGARLSNALEDVFSAGYGRAVLVDPICPGMDDICLRRAFERLEYYDIVIGPTTDNRVYLVGTKPEDARILDDVDWEVGDSLAQLLDTCRAKGFRPHVMEALPSLYEDETLERGYYTGLFRT